MRLRRVLTTHRELIVVARTDAADGAKIARRARAFAEAGADAILVEAVQDLGRIQVLKHQVTRPFMVNQIAGGKSPTWRPRERKNTGVSLVNYSTPCPFATHKLPLTKQ